MLTCLVYFTAIKMKPKVHKLCEKHDGYHLNQLSAHVWMPGLVLEGHFLFILNGEKNLLNGIFPFQVSFLKKPRTNSSEWRRFVRRGP